MNELVTDNIDFSKDLRTLVHNIRGSVGIISSSVEMIKSRDIGNKSQKYYGMLLRQNARILMETELFGAVYSLKEEIFPVNRVNLKELL